MLKEKMQTGVIVLASVLIVQSANAQRIFQLNDVGSQKKEQPAELRASVSQTSFAEAKAVRNFTINPALQRAGNVKAGDMVNLQLFENDIYTATVSNITTDVNGTLALTLKIPDYPMGFAIITTSTEGKSLVNVSIPELGKSFGSRYGVNSSGYYMIEVDESKIGHPHCETGNDAITIPEEIEIIENQDESNFTPGLRDAQIDCGPEYNTNLNSPTTISVLIVYTSAAASSSYTSSRGGINNVITSMIALGNLCFSNSLTSITLQLAHSAQVNYTGSDLSPALSALQNPSDGSMDDVHALRKQYNADLVQLLCAGNTGGLGYLLQNTSGAYEYGFSAAGIESCGDSYPCSVHEIGHNMGLGHGVQHIANWAYGIFPYSYGWRWTGEANKKGSVMTYWSGENYSDGIRCYNVPYFSNPSVNFEGQTGVAEGGYTTTNGSDATGADAARSLREMKHVIAYYSDKIANLPDTPTNIVVSNPTDNGVTISWDAVANATSYRVTIYVIGNSGAYYYWTTSSNTRTFNSSGIFAQCSTYYFYVQALNECGDASLQSPILTFTTKCATDPNVVTLAATNVGNTTATLNKNVTVNGTAVTAQGFKYKKTSESAWQTSANGNLTGLTASTQYSFYAYATTASATFSGNTLTFTTALCAIENQCDYTLVANDSYGDGWNGAALVFKQNGTEVGRLTAINHSLNNTATSDILPISFCRGIATEIYFISGSYDSEISFTLKDMDDNVIYTVAKEDAVNLSTTAAIYTFTSCPIPPTVTTEAATNITQTSATLNKTVTANGTPITEQGFKYKKASESSWSTSVDGNLTSLTAGTQYQFYAYATTASGTINGSTLTFTTLADATPPVPGNSGAITTASITAQTLTLNWTKATDNVSAASALKYYIYQSTSANIGTVTDCEENGTLLKNGGTANIATYAVTGLSPNAAYYFNVVVEDGAGNKAVYTTKSATTDPVYGVSIATFTGGTVTKNKNDYEAGETVTLTIATDAGYILETLAAFKTGEQTTTIALSGSGNTRTFTMPAYGVTVTATFRNPDLEAVNTAKGLIEGMTTPVTVTQTDAPNEATLKTWLATQINALQGMTATGITITAANINVSYFTAAVAGTPDNQSGTNGSYTFTVQLNKGGGTQQTTAQRTLTITATPYTPPATHSVNIGLTSNGTVSVSPDNPVAETATVTLTILPAEGYELDVILAHKTGDSRTEISLSGAGATRTFTMPAYDVTVNAAFKETADRLSVEAAQHSIENTTWNVAQATANTQPAVTAWLVEQINSLDGIYGTGITVPASDITINSFTAAVAGTSGNPSGTNGDFSFTVSLSKGASSASATASATITATAYVAPPTYAVTLETMTNGTLTVSPQGSLAAGTSVTLTIDPATGYELAAISAYRTDIQETAVALTGSGNTRTFTMPDYGVTVAATFTKTQAQLDKEAVAAAKAAVEGGAYSVAQATANEATSVLSWLVNTLNVLFGQSHNVQFRSATSITGDVTITTLTPAVEGTSGNPSGVNGSFEFTVNLVKGASVETATVTNGVIVATPYATTVKLVIPQTQTLKAFVINGILYVSGLIQDELLSIYNMEGKLFHQEKVTVTEKHIYLREHGIYVVASGGRTVKVVF